MKKIKISEIFFWILIPLSIICNSVYSNNKNIIFIYIALLCATIAVVVKIPELITALHEKKDNNDREKFVYFFCFKHEI